MSTLVTVTYHLPGRQKTFVSDSEIGTLLKFKKEYGEAEHQVIKVSIQRVEKDGETKTTTITSAPELREFLGKVR
jgi:hypothetical protein|tara:strand:+ start:537 stop:761 length:225 start_codon:yes stop_codon:yes gene_type:complete